MTKRNDAAAVAAELLKQTGPGDVVARLEAARAEARLLRADLRNTRAELGRALEVGDLIRDAARAMSPPTAYPKPGKGKVKPSVALLSLVSDLQTGEHTEPKETDGWGRFNYAIADARMARLSERSLRYVDIQRSGYRIDECHVFLLGDMVSGDIHEELLRTNEVPPPVQAILAGRLVARHVSAMAGSFPRVVAHTIGGSNHSRLTKKYQFKGGTLNSYDYVAYQHAEALTTNYSNVAWKHYASKKPLVHIGRFGFLCAHGDHIRAWMGVPWYGMERDLGREARRRMQKIVEQLRRELPVTEGFDYGIGAHWHTPFVGPSFSYIVNGSLTGTTELDHTVGRHAPPQQVTAMLSQKHGWFAPTAWRLDDDGEAKLMADNAMDSVLGSMEANV